MALNAGKELPAFCQDAPELLPGAEFYLSGFFKIYNYRQAQSEYDYVAFLELSELAKRLDIQQGQDFWEFERYFRELEKVYLHHVSELAKKQGEETSKNKKLLKSEEEDIRGSNGGFFRATKGHG